MQEPTKDPVAEAAKADDKKIQRPIQQWVKKEKCLKEEAKGSSLGSKPQKPQAQAKPPTQAAKDNEEMYVPPARINMSIRQQGGSPLQRLALIDMSADKNMLSHQTWCKLGKPNLESTTKFVQKSANVFGDCLGAIEISLEISNHSERAKFYVMAPGNLHEEDLVGKTELHYRVDPSTHVLP